MKNLKLLLLGLLTPLFFGGVFAFDLTADEVSYLNNNALNQGSFTNQALYTLYYNPNHITYDNLCVVFSWLVRNYRSSSYNIYGSTADNWAPAGWSIHDDFARYHLYCLPYWNFEYLKLSYASAYKYETFTTNYFWVLDANKIINWYLGFDVQDLLYNYNQCSTDLNQCDTSVQQCLLDKESLSWQLASCNEDKISLNNNIDSLTLQLQNCLWQSCNGSGDYWTGAIFNQYSLYRTDDEIDYSTPITNNLFLPLGYKWKINEDNILSIAKINTLESAYQFSESDKPVVINSMWFVMLFFLGTWLLIVVIMYLRRFISKK